MTVSVGVDLTNPGQFFAACGLFELIARLEPGVRGHFEVDRFTVSCRQTLGEVMDVVAAAPLEEIRAASDAEESEGEGEVDRSAPLRLGGPFALRLDWWRDRAAGGKELKVWAGTMNNMRIAAAMFTAVATAPEYRSQSLFDVGQIVEDPATGKKVEPFYFDARRAPNAHSRDVGFSPDALDMLTTAFPAVELFCLIGLQRFRPAAVRRRVFSYRAWREPLPVQLAALAVAGAVPVPSVLVCEFENWYRTGQKKHKAFRAAVPVSQGD